jgi:hypothetical protein
MKGARAHEHKFQAQDDGRVLAERGGRVRKAGTELRSFAGVEEEVRMRVVVVHAVPSSWLSQCTCWGGGALERCCPFWWWTAVVIVGGGGAMETSAGQQQETSGLNKEGACLVELSNSHRALKSVM